MTTDNIKCYANPVASSDAPNYIVELVNHIVDQGYTLPTGDRYVEESLRTSSIPTLGLLPPTKYNTAALGVEKLFIDQGSVGILDNGDITRTPTVSLLDFSDPRDTSAVHTTIGYPLVTVPIGKEINIGDVIEPIHGVFAIVSGINRESGTVKFNFLGYAFEMPVGEESTVNHSTNVYRVANSAARKETSTSYNLFADGTVAIDGTIYESLGQCLEETKLSNAQLKCNNTFNFTQEDLKICTYYDETPRSLPDKSKSLMKQLKTALDHPLNVESKEWALLLGPSGSGKTTLALEYAKELGRKAIVIQGTDQLTVEDLIGYKSVTTGKYIKQPLRDAVEKGYILILDEADACNPNTLLVLNSLKHEFFHFPDAEVKVHENFRLIATANTLLHDEEYNGRNKLDKATLARFSIINYDLSSIDFAVRYGLDYYTQVEDTLRKTPREIEREIRNIKIKEMSDE